MLQIYEFPYIVNKVQKGVLSFFRFSDYRFFVEERAVIFAGIEDYETFCRVSDDNSG